MNKITEKRLLYNEYHRIIHFWHSTPLLEWMPNDSLSTTISQLLKANINIAPDEDAEVSQFKIIDVTTFSNALLYGLDHKLKVDDGIDIKTRTKLAFFFFYPVLIRGHSVESVLLENNDTKVIMVSRETYNSYFSSHSLRS